MIYDYVVIGSGVSALGCILGLLKNNKKILCIDGSEILPEISNVDDEYNFDFSEHNIPIKKFHFKKKHHKFFRPIEVLESYSFGGLSNVWGASALRYLKEDFKDWPISYDILNQYYNKCEEKMNVSHYDDEISEELKINNNFFDQKKLNLYSDFIKNFLKKNVKSNRYKIGYSRVALYNDSRKFSTNKHIKELIEKNKIEYIKNLILEKFIVNSEHIELKFKSSDVKILTKKLFLGAGPLNTPRIVINSMKNKQDLSLKESQVFFIPALYLGENFKTNESEHKLVQSQFFFINNLKYNIGKISYQIKYDPKLNNSLIKKQFSLLYNFIPQNLINRIFLIAGFIHNDYSTFDAKIKKDDLNVEVNINRENKIKAKKEILDQLKIVAKDYKFLPIKPFLKFGEFGQSYHLGGSIPMLNNKNNNLSLFTKTNGEISQFKNVFIVDSTSFPNIPAGSISLTAMANALRIGNEISND